MLQEERARKRVEQLKPKVRFTRFFPTRRVERLSILTAYSFFSPPQLEHDLLISLPRWEQDNSRAFMVNGERVLEVIQAGIDAKEAEKEARKVSSIFSLSFHSSPSSQC